MAFTTTADAYILPLGTALAERWWKAGRVSIKASGAETGGRFSQVITDDPRGTAPPLHLHHNEEETFYVLDGEVSVIVDGERTDLAAGDFALVPRGVPHAYLVRSERARMLVTFSPSGFEDAFLDLGIPATDGKEAPVEQVMPSPDELERAFAAYGCEILGPPPAL